MRNTKLMRAAVAAITAAAMLGSAVPALAESGIEGLGSEVEGLVAEEGAEIEIAYWEGSPAEEAAWAAVLEQLQADHPEIKYTLQTYPSIEFRDMLDTRVAGNDWPDVIRYTYQRLGKFKSADVMLDLTPYISEENYADIAGAYQSAAEYNGKLVCMPHHADTLAVFYNKTMFEEAGIRIPTSVEDGWTWEEMADIARTLKEQYDLPFGFSGLWETNSGYRFLPFVYMNGGALMNDDQTEVTMETPEVIETLQYYADLRAEDLISNTAFTGDAAAKELFTAGQVAFSFCGSWHCSYMQENMPDNWGVTYMPVRDGQTGSDMGGNALFGYAGTKYPKATAITIEYLTNAENMKLFCETGNFLPVRSGLLSEGLEYTAYQDEMKIFSDIIATVDPKMAADETSAVFQQFNEIWNENMDPLVVNSSATPEQVAANCQAQMTEILNEMG